MHAVFVSVALTSATAIPAGALRAPDPHAASDVNASVATGVDRAMTSETRAGDPGPIWSTSAGPLAAAPTRWHWSVTPYAWFTHLDGEVEANGTEGDVDVAFQDLLQDLDLAAMVHAEFGNERFGLMTDVVYAALSAEEGHGTTTVDAESQLTIAELGGYWRIQDRVLETSPPGKSESRMNFDLLGGVRYMESDTSVDLTGGTTASADQREGWLDVYVGARMQAELSEKHYYSVRSDLGGFGLEGSSRLTWNLVATLAYRIGSHASLGVGFRVLDVDFEDEDFRYDVRMVGPMIGLEFN